MVAVFAALGAGTVATLEGGLRSREETLPAGWYSVWRLTWAPLLGLAFSAAGVARFALLELFCSIYPGRGRGWAVWYLPGTSSFHVKWTGIAEQAGGVELALGRLGVGADFGLEKESVAGLSALELGVTPANMYMFSQGTPFPKGLKVPVGAHAVRGFLQRALPAFVWILASA